MHAEPIDPRNGLGAGRPRLSLRHRVDRNGRRFFDEGGGLVHETWETFRAAPFRDARAHRLRHPRRPPLGDRRLSARHPLGVAPHRADTLEHLELADRRRSRKTRRDREGLQRGRNGDPARFDATRPDGLAATADLRPPKSNWARNRPPPFLAYPLTGAIAYTFGGIATNAKAEVGGAANLSPPSKPGRDDRAFLRYRPQCGFPTLRALVRVAAYQAVRFLRSRSRPAAARRTAPTARRAARYHTGVEADEADGRRTPCWRPRALRGDGATRFCMGAAWREPKDRDLEQVARMVREVKALGLETCATLGMLTGEQAQRSRRPASTTTTTTSTPRPSTTARSSRRAPTRTGSTRSPTCARPASTSAAAASSAWARARTTARGLLATLASLSRIPRSVPINHAGAGRGHAAPSTAPRSIPSSSCARSRSPASRCRRRSCACPPAARR